MESPRMSRRDFVRMGAGAAVAGAAVKSTLLDPPVLAAQEAADGRKIRFGIVGTGIRGCDLLRSARKVTTGICVGSADLYSTRLQAGKEAYGADFDTTGDYRRLLDRKDVDAILVATSDHHHRRITLDAVAAGKDVYCEKPMSHSVEDGFAMVEGVQAHKAIFQAGSQRVSSILYAKAKEIYAQWNRNTPGGAWVYPIPPDASPETIDWKGYLVDAPQQPFDTKKFFRWRCFRDFGSGLGGDLFVHLLSGIQVITGIHKPAHRAYSTGGIYHYKDGRDFPDLLETVYDFPTEKGDFHVHLHCNQANSDGDEGIKIYGSTGTIVMTGKTVTFTPQDVRPKFEGYGWGGLTAAQRAKGLEEFNAAHPEKLPAPGDAESFSVPQGYDDTAVHIGNFFNAIVTREHVVEDELFGHNAAIGCHMANQSFFHGGVAKWDAATKTIKA